MPSSSFPCKAVNKTTDLNLVCTTSVYQLMEIQDVFAGFLSLGCDWISSSIVYTPDYLNPSLMMLDFADNVMQDLDNARSYVFELEKERIKYKVLVTLIILAIGLVFIGSGIAIGVTGGLEENILKTLGFSVSLALGITCIFVVQPLVWFICDKKFDDKEFTESKQKKQLNNVIRQIPDDLVPEKMDVLNCRCRLSDEERAKIVQLADAAAKPAQVGSLYPSLK